MIYLKTYILDTCAVLNAFEELLNTKENSKFVIPETVIEELDGQKIRDGELGYLARKATRKLYSFIKGEKLNDWISIENNNCIKIEDDYASSDTIDTTINDNKILATLPLYENSTLITDDINLILKANSLGFDTEFSMDINADDGYDGHVEVEVDDSIVEEFYRSDDRGVDIDSDKYKGHIDWSDVLDTEPRINSCVTLVSNLDSKRIYYTIYRNGRLEKLKYGKTKVFGSVEGKNRQQKYLLEMLMDKEIKIVAVNSEAGSGKSFLATVAGLQQTLEEGYYNKILYVKPLVAMGGADIGFLPNSKEDKLLNGYSGTITNILENIFQEKKKNTRNKVTLTI